MEEWYPKDKTCIVGIGETEYTRWGRIERPEFQLTCEAILKAIDDAGLKVSDIDGMCSFAGDRNFGPAIATTLGIPELNFVNMYLAAGGGGGSMPAVMNASIGVATGTCKYAVVWRSLCQGQFGRIGVGRAPERAGGAQAFTAPYGFMTAAHSLAVMQARRHMHLYGTTKRQHGAVAVAAYKHAQRNPRAVMYGKPLTMEAYLNARIIDWPLVLYDYTQENDGACAIVVTTAERARDLRHRPVYIMAAAQGCGERQADGYNVPDYATSMGMQVAAHLWARAGISPKDIDVAQIYENFVPNVVASFEDLGFCKRGEGGPFAEGGRLEWPDGELPLNTAGGHLAEAYIHGLEMANEGTRQMRGTSTCQVEGAEICLCQVAGNSTNGNGAILLRR